MSSGAQFSKTATTEKAHRYYVFSRSTGKQHGPETFGTIQQWVRQAKVRLEDLIAEAGAGEWVPLARSDFAEFSNELLHLVQDIELGPDEKKIEAIGQLRRKQVPLHRVGDLLRRILVSAPEGLSLRFVAAANLAALGDHSETVVDALLPYLGCEPFEISDGGSLYFGWLEGLEDSFLEGTGLGHLLRFSTQLAAIEALSYIKDSERVANALIMILDAFTKKQWRLFALYAIAAQGHPSTKSRLKYYQDRYSNTPEGAAAIIGLEHFGQKTPTELGQLHRKQQSVKPKRPCFIATAVYGADSNEVQILRTYRDKVMSQSVWGRFLVLSYSYLSPPVAWFVSRSKKLKVALSRFVLTPMVKICEKQIK